VSETQTLTHGTGDACRRCEQPMGGFGFCLSCGAAAAADGGDPATEPGPPSRLRRVLRSLARWRTPVVVVPLLGALSATGAMGAQMMTAEIPPPEPDVQVTCWDGGEAGSAEACTAPSGEAGLRWVFPTFHPDRDGCVDVLIEHPEYARPAMYECDFKASGRWVTVAYMQLAGVDPARRFFEKDFPMSERERVRTAEGTAYRYVWRQRTEDGFELAAMYIDFPYAVSITAPKASHRDLALRKLAFRHPDRISVSED
jgi:hypothetical protein